MLTDNKVAIITGVTRGIGKAMASAFARDGINLVGVSRNKEKIIEVLQEIKLKHKVDYLAIQTDVSKSENVEKRAIFSWDYNH